VAVVMAFTWLRRILPRSNLHRPTMKENLFFFFSLCARQHLTIDPHYDIIISFSLQLFIRVCSLYISPEHEKKGKRRSYTYYASFKYLE
jgi:hypothetical protein